MKMIKNILFEVLPIASYTLFPSVWQLVDATPKKLSLFWDKPVIESFSYIFVRSEVLKLVLFSVENVFEMSTKTFGINDAA